MAETVKWTDPDGTTVTLPIEWAVQGRGMPPVEAAASPNVARPGSTIRNIRHGQREIDMSMWVVEPTDPELRDELRDLAYLLDPTRGLGTLEFTAPGGDKRAIACYLSQGMICAKPSAGNPPPPSNEN